MSYLGLLSGFTNLVQSPIVNTLKSAFCGTVMLDNCIRYGGCIVTELFQKCIGQSSNPEYSNGTYVSKLVDGFYMSALGTGLMVHEFMKNSMGRTDSFTHSFKLIDKIDKRHMALCSFNMKVVDFANNYPRDDISEENLKKPGSICKILSYLLESVPIEKSSLPKLKNMKRDGVCFGASLDFLAKVIMQESKQQLMQQNPTDCIKTVAKSFQNHCTDRGALLQWVYGAAGDSEDVLFPYSNSSHNFEINEHDSLNRQYNSLREKHINGSLSELDVYTEPAKSDKFLFEAVRMLRHVMEKNVREQISRITLISLLGLKTQIMLEMNSNLKDSIEPLSRNLTSLRTKPGKYLVSLMGHAIAVFVESDTRAYFFDPNFATWVVENEQEFENGIKTIFGLYRKDSDSYYRTRIYRIFK